MSATSTLMMRASLLLAVASLVLTALHAARATGAADKGECSKEVSVPAEGGGLQNYFEGIRMEYGILGNKSYFLGEGEGRVDASKCTKQDVCLLMRQLDIDFYERARSGLLQDADYEIAPTPRWVKKGICKGRSKIDGFPMKRLTDEDECKEAVEKEGGEWVEKGKFSLSSPTGCVIQEKVKGGKSVEKKGYLNKAKTQHKAGSLRSKSTVMLLQKTSLLCVMDRSLTEASAAYFSPYKLKPSKIENPHTSTSCSFGSYAALAQIGETKSPCAKILTYRLLDQFSSADEAEKFADTLDSEEAAELLRDHVKDIRMKDTLQALIAEKWCPGVWKNALLENGGTCKAPRVMAWTKQGQELAAPDQKSASSALPSRPVKKSRGARAARKGNRAQLDRLKRVLKAEEKSANKLREDEGRSVSRDKPIKIALTANACDATSAFEDEDLETAMGKLQAENDK